MILGEQGRVKQLPAQILVALAQQVRVLTRFGGREREREREGAHTIWREAPPLLFPSISPSPPLSLILLRVLGCTRAATMRSTSVWPSLEGLGNLCEMHRGGDGLLPLLHDGKKERERGEREGGC